MHYNSIKMSECITLRYMKKNLSPTKPTTIVSCAVFCADSDGILGFFCTGLVFEIVAILVFDTEEEKKLKLKKWFSRVELIIRRLRVQFLNLFSVFSC